MSVSFVTHESSNPMESILSVIIGLFMTFFVVTHSLWYSFGFEKLTLSNGNLTIEKSCRIFSIKRTIPIKDIIDIKVPESSFEPVSELNSPQTIADEIEDVKRGMNETRRASFIWNRTGKLLIQTKGENYNVLNGLKEDKYFTVQNMLRARMGISRTTNSNI